MFPGSIQQTVFFVLGEQKRDFIQPNRICDWSLGWCWSDCGEYLWQRTKRCSLFKAHFKTFKSLNWKIKIILSYPYNELFRAKISWPDDKKRKCKGTKLIIRIMHHWRILLVKQFMYLQRVNKSSSTHMVFHSLKNKMQ